ncbi:MAG: hypothetical protein H5T61_15915 [Thermoflexales bacterium]|nr:hypothetical protein [Thermoflexales bacterium]
MLREEEYEAGMERLREEMRGRGEGALVVSEMTLMAVEARKGGGRVGAFRFGKLVLDKIRG